MVFEDSRSGRDNTWKHAAWIISFIAVFLAAFAAFPIRSRLVWESFFYRLGSLIHWSATGLSGQILVFLFIICLWAMMFYAVYAVAEAIYKYLASDDGGDDELVNEYQIK